MTCIFALPPTSILCATLVNYLVVPLSHNSQFKHIFKHFMGDDAKEPPSDDEEPAADFLDATPATSSESTVLYPADAQDTKKITLREHLAALDNVHRACAAELAKVRMSGYAILTYPP